MNTDIFRYKCRFITGAVLLGYAFIHTVLTGIYSELSFIELIHFTERLPYSQRLLVPALVRFASFFLPLDVSLLFFLMEWLFITLFYCALYQLLQEDFSPRPAQLLSWLFILILPLITVVNYRLHRQGTAAVFYPSDTPALFFSVSGFLLCLRSKWTWFTLLVFLATLNRESSILLVLVVPALHWQKRNTLFKPIFFSLLAYLLARVLILQFLGDLPGHIVECYPKGRTTTLFEDNLLWLLDEENCFLFLFCFAGLPLFWFAFFDYIPSCYRPIRFIALFYFLALLIVGRCMEARIFSEIVALLYFPVCLALKGWLLELEPAGSLKTGFSYNLERWFVIGILILIVVFWRILNKVVISFAWIFSYVI